MITTCELGTAYEYFVLEEIRKEYDNVWHWSKFPEKLMFELGLIKDYNTFAKYRYDIGADLVAAKNDTYYFIQCKNFNNIIHINDLAGFYFFVSEFNVNGIVYYNGSLSQRISDLSTGRIKYINMPFNNATINKQIANIEIIPRTYQTEAIAKLKNKQNAILSLPCGMGKSYVAGILSKYYDNVIMLSPLRSLAMQTLDNFKQYLGKSYNPILISVDGDRSIDKIKRIIKKKNVVSATYDSADIVWQIIGELTDVYIIIDEFHNLSTNNLTCVDNDIYKILHSIADKLYLSATPIKNFLDLPYECVYSYDWQKAINEKYICDFTIYLPTNKVDIAILEILKTDINHDIKLTTKAYFLLKSMLFNGDRKCIVYLTSVEKANEFDKILNWLHKMLNVKLDKCTITYNTARTNRSKYINEFTNTNNIAIMLNVHILDEGINIPECDCVFITKPNDNIINIVQRMSRANRIMQNKLHCNVYMWTTQNKANKVMDYISDKIEDLIENKVKCFDCVKLINKHYQYAALNRDNHEENICKRVGNVDTKLLCNLTKEFYVYMQTHSTLPKEFIKDFFGLNSSMDKYNFCINLNAIAKWMGSRKCDLKETVINSYKKNVDYQITKNVSNGKVGKPGETIMLTPKCFKMMAMQTRSKKGVQVREYYYELEQVVDQYKEYIIQGLQEKI